LRITRYPSINENQFFGCVAAFVDSGVLSTQHSFDFNQVSTGVGVGLRYDLGFAPLRADIAVPIQRRTGDASIQVYLSIGQSF